MASLNLKTKVKFFYKGVHILCVYNRKVLSFEGVRLGSFHCVQRVLIYWFGTEGFQCIQCVLIYWFGKEEFHLIHCVCMMSIW